MKHTNHTKQTVIFISIALIISMALTACEKSQAEKDEEAKTLNAVVSDLSGGSKVGDAPQAQQANAENSK